MSWRRVKPELCPIGGVVREDTGIKTYVSNIGRRERDISIRSMRDMELCVAEKQENTLS